MIRLGRILLLTLLPAWGAFPGLVAAPLPTQEVSLNLKELPNGFRYALIPCATPPERLHFRLILGVGSQDEGRGEAGAAHFVEHLAFRTTKGFADGELIAKLQDLGLVFGRDINAHTGYDRTVYDFWLPSGPGEAHERLNFGLDIVREWLTGIRFDWEVVRTETRVIEEEISGYPVGDTCLDRIRLGEDQRLHRLPIATIPDVRKLTPRKLRDFYRRHYTAQNATLLVSGNLPDLEAARSQVQARFEGLEARRGLRARPQTLAYGRRDARCPSLGNGCEIFVPLVQPVVLNSAGLMDERLEQMALGCINERFYRAGIDAHISLSWLLNGTRHLRLRIGAQDREECARALCRAGGIVAGLRDTGPDANEWQEALDQERSRVRNYAYPSTSLSICEFLTDIALTQSHGFVSRTEYEGILDSIAALPQGRVFTTFESIATWLLDSTSILVLGPEGKFLAMRGALARGLGAPDTNSYAKARATGASRGEVELMALPQTDTTGAIVSHTIHPRLGLHQWQLRNGVRLLVREMDDADGKISVALNFRGGLSLAPGQEYSLYEPTVAYMTMGGVEHIPFEDYTEFLAREAISLVATHGDLRHGMLATCPVGKIELLGQVLYAQCFHPEARTGDYAEIIEEKIHAMRSKRRPRAKSSPIRLLGRLTDSLTGQIPFPLAEPDSLQLRSTPLSAYAQHFRELFTRAHGLECVVIGPITPGAALSALLPLLLNFTKGTAPAHKATNAARRKARKPHLGKIPVALRWAAGNTEQDPSQRLAFSFITGIQLPPGLRGDLLGKILRDMARDILIARARGEAGIAYSPYAEVRGAKRTPGQAFIVLQGEISNQNLDKLHHLVQDFAQDLETACTEETIAAIKRSFLLNRRATLLPNARNAWRSYLDRNFEAGISPDQAERYEDILGEISREDILKIIFSLENGILAVVGI